MKTELEKVTYVVLYSVTFGMGEDGGRSEHVGYFSVKSEAQKVAALKRGSYGGTGSVWPKEFAEHANLPKYYVFAEDWFKANLTVNEYEKLKQFSR